MIRDQFPAMCRACGLPEPVKEHRFHPTRKWRFDYAWPEQLLALESQGGTWRRGGGAHSGAGAIRDYEKFSEAAVLGWRVLMVPAYALPKAQTFDLIRRALA